jgi:hypothetical protein
LLERLMRSELPPECRAFQLRPECTEDLELLTSVLWRTGWQPYRE